MRIPRPVRPLRVPATVDLEACRAEVQSIDRWGEISMIEYSVKTDWSAFSLTGFTSSPYDTQIPHWRFRQRPSTADDIVATEAAPRFPACLAAAASLPGRNERVRINRLGSGSVIPRHHDRNEPWVDRTRVRFHIPLVTDWRCVLLVWGLDDVIYEVCQQLGQAWFLDTQMVHAGANGSRQARLHLVVDKFVDADVEAFLAAADAQPFDPAPAAVPIPGLVEVAR